MFTNANDIKKDSQMEADICIIGAGAAGIAMALALKDLPIKIVMLESGGLEHDALTQEFNKVQTTDLPIGQPSRARRFGGTTSLWVGCFKPHDSIDFTKRDWVPGSGWPLSRQDLEPYYKQSSLLLDAPNYESFALQANDVADDYKIASEALEPTIFRWFAKSDFDWGKKHQATFAKQNNINVVLLANAVNITKDKNKATGIEVKTLQGNQFSVRAKHIVLAGGGLENARLLLVGNIGNEYDQVGRYYMDHPKEVLGSIKPVTSAVLNLYWGKESSGKKVRAGIRLADNVQKEKQVLNSYVLLEPVFVWSFNKGVPWSHYRGIAGAMTLAGMFRGQRVSASQVAKSVLAMVLDPVPLIKFTASQVVKKLAPARWRQPKAIKMWNFMEQEPRPENRVTLSSQKDAFGLPLVKLSWTVSDLDKKTMVVLHKTLQEQLNALGVGVLESPLLDGGVQPWPIVRDASHHMGTTRMGNDPKTSVVDANCKVHGMDNIYVAGSSVFATSGYANPTYTIVALAVRLADHLKNKLVNVT